MRACAALTAAPPVDPGGPTRLTRLAGGAPVAWRATPDAVYLVGTAATPVGDDRVDIDVFVETGATLRVRSAAATVAWRATATEQRITATVADGGRLDWHLQPLIATAGCHHRQRAVIALLGRASVSWTEELILGRHGEDPGCLDLRVDVDIDRRPLLRHQLRVGPDAPGWAGPAVLGANRHVGFVLRAGAGASEVDSAAGPGWAVLPLDGPGHLIVAVATDLPALRAAMTAAELAAGGFTGAEHTAGTTEARVP